MDLIGPLPATKSGHTWIVTWVDRTSKMIVAAAAKEGQMSSEALALMTCLAQSNGNVSFIPLV